MNSYVDQVRVHLSSLAPAERQQALDDLEDLLAEGIVPEDLGSPHEYAQQFLEDLERPHFRLPGGLGFTAKNRARIWDPMNPRLFVPRAFGLGWRVNVGALAVKLGWLRPDDADADVVDAIPADVRALQRALPYLAAGEATLYALVAARQQRVPRHWSVVGQVDGWMDRRWLPLPVAAAYAIAWWGTKPAIGEDTVIRPALAAAGAGLVDAVMFATVFAAKPGKKHGWVGPLIALTPAAVELAATVLPLRAGIDHVTAAHKPRQS